VDEQLVEDRRERLRGEAEAVDLERGARLELAAFLQRAFGGRPVRQPARIDQAQPGAHHAHVGGRAVELVDLLDARCRALAQMSIDEIAEAAERPQIVEAVALVGDRQA